MLIKALAQWKHAEVKRKASKARFPSFSHVLPLRHYWQKAWSLLKQRLVIELIDVVGSSDNMEELWSGRKVKSCFGNLSLSCIPKLSRSIHSWTDHALVLAEWIKNSQFPLRDAPARSHGNCIHHLGLDICFDEYSAGMSQRGNSPLMLQYNYNITAHSSSGQFSYVSAWVYELNITKSKRWPFLFYCKA